MMQARNILLLSYHSCLFNKLTIVLTFQYDCRTEDA